MYEANAYRIKEGQETLILEFVDIVEPEDNNQWRLAVIFGGSKNIKSCIKRMNLGNITNGARL
ncbi:MAG: CooT family nickel-binding protein [Desulfobacteraceae bacterium]|nr:CooT family nickel-binding protein [Desulfobacteraceae bacterium]